MNKNEKWNSEKRKSKKKHYWPFEGMQLSRSSIFANSSVILQISRTILIAWYLGKEKDIPTSLIRKSRRIRRTNFSKKYWVCRKSRKSNGIFLSSRQIISRCFLLLTIFARSKKLSWAIYSLEKFSLPIHFITFWKKDLRYKEWNL